MNSLLFLSAASAMSTAAYFYYEYTRSKNLFIHGQPMVSHIKAKPLNNDTYIISLTSKFSFKAKITSMDFITRREEDTDCVEIVVNYEEDKGNREFQKITSKYHLVPGVKILNFTCGGITSKYLYHEG